MERSISKRSIGEWMARLVDERPLDAVEIEQFQSWLRGDPDRVHQLKEHAGSYRAMRELLSQPGLSAELDRLAPLPAWRVWWERVLEQRLALAAVPVVAVLAAALYVLGSPGTSVFETGAGEKQRVELADGSVIVLSENARLRLVDDQQRTVALEQGRAFFKIARDEARPFRVETSQGDVRVLGTTFNVELQSRRLLVGVLEGEVEVAGNRTRVGDPYHLQSGDQLMLEAGGATATLLDVSGDAISGGSPARLEFQNLPLSELIDQLNNGGSQVWDLQDEIAGSQRVSGSLQMANEEGIRFLLRESYGLATIDEGDRIVLYRAVAR